MQRTDIGIVPCAWIFDADKTSLILKSVFTSMCLNIACSLISIYRSFHGRQKKFVCWNKIENLFLFFFFFFNENHLFEVWLRWSKVYLEWHDFETPQEGLTLSPEDGLNKWTDVCLSWLLAIDKTFCVCVRSSRRLIGIRRLFYLNTVHRWRICAREFRRDPKRRFRDFPSGRVGLYHVTMTSDSELWTENKESQWIGVVTNLLMV